MESIEKSTRIKKNQQELRKQIQTQIEIKTKYTKSNRNHKEI